jgi:acyl-CoA reductase-like NAD-dependent aldehyde dehydrogenase
MFAVARTPDEPRRYGHWIDNEEVDGTATFTTPDPATGTVLAHLARGNKSDVDRAVASAKKAFPAWSRTDPNERARLLWKAGEAILADLDALARAEAIDVGKPISNARTIDVPRTADTFFYFSGWATKIHGETIPVRGPLLTYTLREPLGVVAAIVPWNFPLLLAARKIAPALAAGNTIVVKPPEEASLSILRLARILGEAGLPPGVLNVVTGFGEDAGDALVKHPDIAKISFTGGTDTGKLIVRNAAATLKKVTMELGGKSPNVIFADADLGAASKAAVSAAFYNQGELCTSGSRLLVERRVHDEVLDSVVAGTRALVTGDSLDPRTNVGPLVSAAHLERVAGYVEKGQAEGAERIAGGGHGGPGFFHEPTVFAGVRSEMAIAREEIFGPVVSVLAFEDLEEAAAIADATDYGLAAGVWTRDIGKAHALAHRIQAGTVWINTYNRFDAAAPYGGTKQSGYGRENGFAAIEEYTQRKTIWVALG